jgi:hypothetical protein
VGAGLLNPEGLHLNIERRDDNLQKMIFFWSILLTSGQKETFLVKQGLLLNAGSLLWEDQLPRLGHLIPGPSPKRRRERRRPKVVKQNQKSSVHHSEGGYAHSWSTG